ncbi:MAG: quinone-dependent dihydroorotate dehydrogenase [Leptolyngbyaceae cyanobacterium CSU_1_4]|nr:quinone-dependent dihydroorotate dehydrogenase [Leptolyngbyaceae cyanobacterium CSU_1_4]
MDIYKSGIRPLLFQGLNVDPEQAHHQSLQVLDWLARHGDRPPLNLLRQQIKRTCCFEHPSLEQCHWGSKFPNPLGIAAGFDKDGVAAPVWQDFGFGFAELGTVTFYAQSGNPKPRMFRLPLDEAALNRMGFNNLGAAALAERLEKQLEKRLATAHPSRLAAGIPIGINLGKSKITALEDAAADYLGSFRLLKNLGDYFVVNVSSPNTPGLRSLQSTEQLEPILSALQQENSDQKPLFVKIAPDLEWEAIAAVIQLAKSHRLAGMIATNTTIRRDHLKTQVIATTGNSVNEEAGGISGAPLRARSTEVIRFIYQQTGGTLPIIGVGGIFTADDAWEKITAGASLIQVYTGWIYEGPGMVPQILKGLVQKIEEQGLQNIGEAIGVEAGQ